MLRSKEQSIESTLSVLLILPVIDYSTLSIFLLPKLYAEYTRCALQGRNCRRLNSIDCLVSSQRWRVSLLIAFSSQHTVVSINSALEKQHHTDALFCHNSSYFAIRIY